LFTAPEETVDAFACQIDTVITGILDKLAPLRQLRKCPGKRISRWLTLRRKLSNSEDGLRDTGRPPVIYWSTEHIERHAKMLTS
jgi:hypothetical protein